MNIEVISQDTGAYQGMPLSIYNPLEAIFSEHRAKREGIERIAAFVEGQSELLSYFLNGNARDSHLSSVAAQSMFEADGALKALDASFWAKAMALTDVLENCPAAKRNEWNQMIYDLKTPPFERDSVVATLQSMLLNREKFFAEKVDGIFRRLSGEHVTNSPAAFSKRMILAHMLDRYGFLSTTQCEYLHDLRSVIAKINGRGDMGRRTTYRDIDALVREEKFGDWYDFDGGAIRIKVFKKGTAHVEVHPDIAWRLNQILASLYPMAIPSEFRTKPAKQPKEHALVHNTLSCRIIDALARAFERSRNLKGALFLPHDLDKATADEVATIFARLLGGVKGDNGSWEFGYDVTPALLELLRTACIPEQVSHQFYATPETLATRVVALADLGETDEILEPNAGTGGLADHLPKDRTTCVEISPLHSRVLEGKGYRVLTEDFLKYNVNGEKRFDVIIMNPPFSDGRAVAHVKHAASLLRDDSSRLVAILPASLKGKQLAEGWKHEWSESMEGGFADTKVHITILKLHR